MSAPAAQQPAPADALTQAFTLYRRSTVAMDTTVTAQVIARTANPASEAQLDRALGWFAQVEAVCSRFDPSSELSTLCRQVGRPVAVSRLLFGALRIALKVACLSAGAFDPTVGGALERGGFDRNYRTGERTRAYVGGRGGASYRDVQLDTARGTVTLTQPLLLDLGAIAKGLAIDLAARELAGHAGHTVEAGGDLYAGGCNAVGTPWQVGIRHPRQPQDLLAVVAARNQAVCTSGDYARRGAVTSLAHHLLDLRTGAAAAELASATVIAPTAMLADALATTAFALGAVRGLPFLERAGVEGLLVGTDLRRYATRGFAGSAAAPTGEVGGDRNG
jgi:thiamine biosynthesis lipoprotein